jgi:hypothetical protein
MGKNSLLHFFTMEGGTIYGSSAGPDSNTVTGSGAALYNYSSGTSLWGLATTGKINNVSQPVGDGVTTYIVEGAWA